MTLGLIQWPVTLAADQGQIILITTLLLMMFLFFVISGRGRKKEQRNREKMLAELARNDKIVTIGGMVGVITDVKDDEITVKIDESANTKIRMKKWAVRGLEGQESAAKQ